MKDIEKVSNIKAFRVPNAQNHCNKRSSNEAPILLDSGEKTRSDWDFGENKGRTKPLQMQITPTLYRIRKRWLSA